MKAQAQAQKKSTTSPTPAAAPAFQTRPFAAQNEVDETASLQADGSALFGAYVQRRAINTALDASMSSAASSQVPSIQAKLTIGPPNDKYEQEADRVASQVVQQINTPASAQPTLGQSVQRQEEAEEELQAKPEITALRRQEAISGGKASTNLESTINSAKGGGQPLEAGLQQSMGQAMGADFSEVWVHTDARSDQLNQAIQAKAFTTGQDIFFRQGAYQPGSRRGQELIAHELTHVVQQMKGVGINDDVGLEREASVMGAKALQLVRNDQHQEQKLRIEPLVQRQGEKSPLRMNPLVHYKKNIQNNNKLTTGKSPILQMMRGGNHENNNTLWNAIKDFIRSLCKKSVSFFSHPIMVLFFEGATSIVYASCLTDKNKEKRAFNIIGALKLWRFFNGAITFCINRHRGDLFLIGVLEALSNIIRLFESIYSALEFGALMINEGISLKNTHHFSLPGIGIEIPPSFIYKIIQICTSFIAINIKAVRSVATIIDTAVTNYSKGSLIIVESLLGVINSLSSISEVGGSLQKKIVVYIIKLIRGLTTARQPNPQNQGEVVPQNQGEVVPQNQVQVVPHNN